MSTSEKKPRRPFHETIVELIKKVGSRWHRFGPLGELIMATKIPKNHDAIIAAWEERCKDIYDEDGFLADVLADLREQKAEVETEAEAKKLAQSAPLGGVSLNDMHDFDPDFGPT